MLTTSQVQVNHILFHNANANPNTLYCINCGRMLIDQLNGINYSFKIKCSRCKAKINVHKS